ncbi:MAG TPA: hypothetical protein EYP53_09425 [Candidatus Latescibacteria bacterium]|nr:hypothetical protein [Candidatus Latescibacterota bacterium]
MKRILIMTLILSLAATSTTFASSARVNGVGGEHRFLIDTQNYNVYPGRALRFGDAAYLVIPRAGANAIGGVLVKFGAAKDKVLGVHINFPMPNVSALNNILDTAPTGKAAVDGRLAALDVQPWFDVFYAMELKGMKAGIHATYASDKVTDDVQDIETSATAMNLFAGITTEVGGSILDLGAGISTQAFSDDDKGVKTESQDGLGLWAQARCLHRKGESLTLIPMASVALNTRSLGVKGTVTRSSMDVELGLGMEKMIGKSRLILGAIAARSSDSETRGGVELTDTELVLPRLIAGFETPIKKKLTARGGISRSFVFATDEQAAGKEVKTQETVDMYNLGFSVRVKSILIDFLLKKDILQRGPYLITGSADDWATNVCVTYLF